MSTYVVGINDALAVTLRGTLSSVSPPAGGGGAPALLPMPLWSAAQAAQAGGTRNAIIACVGDSVTAGFGACKLNWKHAKVGSYPDVLARLAGGSPHSMWGDQNIPGSGVPDTIWAADPRITQNTGWVSTVATTFGARLYTNSTTTNAISFLPTKSFDRMEIWYPTGVGFGVISYNIDGGADTNIDLNAADGFAKTTVTVAAGLHTINIKRVSGNAYLIGLSVYTAATKEILVYNGGWSGAKAADWIVTTNAYSPKNALTTLAPDLTIINLGINDWNTGTNVATWTIDMQTIITAAKLSGDVILVVPPQTDTATTADAIQAPFRTAIAALAVTNSLNVVDLYTGWGGYTGAVASGYMFDTTHPVGKGYDNLARRVATAASISTAAYTFANAEASTYVAAMGVQPSVARKAIIDTWMEGLKRAAIWTTMDEIKLYAAHDATAALINARSPGTADTTLASAPVFTVDRGYTTDGVDDELQGINPTSGGLNISQDSIFFAMRVLNDRVFAGRPTGWFDGTDGIGFIPRVSGDEFNFRAGQASSSQTTLDDALSSIAFWSANRSGSVATQAYKNGTALASIASPNQASTALNNHKLLIGSGGAADFQIIQVASMYVGSSKGAIGHLYLTAIDLYYQQAVGAA